MRAERGVDVIGDVHGHADRLVDLLRTLGYDAASGWQHPDGRSAVFVGDLIDRGPAQLETLEVVRAMVDAGAARVVLGNHEFNAVAWATVDEERGDFCRRHTPKNDRQHRRFLDAVGEQSDTHRAWIEWFLTIPLWLDLGGLRVVHACWAPVAMGTLGELGLLGEGDTLTPELVVAASRRPDRERVDPDAPTPYDCVEWILKGPELALGELAYLDKEGTSRRRARHRWWLGDAAMTLRAGALIPTGATRPDGTPFPELPADAVSGVPAPYADPVPVVFGHYWSDAQAPIVTDHAACVDLSVAKDGPLAAYRWDGEAQLTAEHLVAV